MDSYVSQWHYERCMGVEIVVVVSHRCSFCSVLKVVDSAVYQFVAAVRLEGEDGLDTWCG